VLMDHLVSALRAAGEPTRIRLLAILARSELTVTELTQIVGQSQPRVSRHLKLLAEAGLIERYREGSWVFYRLSQAGRERTGPGALSEALVRFIPEIDEALQGDLQRLDQARRARAEAAAAYFSANADEWGRLQALHLPEERIEAAMRELVGEADIEDYVDMGTGTGRMLELFGPLARRGMGVDLSHDMLTLARSNLDRAGLRHCQVRHGDIFSLPLANASASLVTIHQVLHFLADPGRAVAEAARVLKKGGRLLIADFAPHSLEFLREEHAHRRLGFATEEVRRWFEDNGLTLSHVHFLGEETEDAATASETQHADSPHGTLTVALWLGERLEDTVSVGLKEVAE